MPEAHRPPSRSHAEREPDASGFDVWLPALVAIATALFMIFGAHAQTVPADTASESVSLFDMATQRQDTIQAVTLAPVTVQPLPPISPDVPAVAPAPVHSATAAPFALPEAAPTVLEIGLSRFAVASLIAMLLISALVALARTWRRTASGAA